MLTKDEQEAIDLIRLSAEGAAEPFVRQILKIRQQARPTYLVFQDGLHLVSDGLSDSDRDMIRRCENTISDIYQNAAERALAETGFRF